ncbi:hypothetical protein [Acinetobacter bereziniae]|uniref:hypothetical protein n=1 Tax=Acinetobacter bereziniae TaxID=106648 RepID=UPI001115D6E4|nr:hypothetical protein [Acinetobacter bereziniae]TNL52022.1 hypothetical protein EYB59_06115 [Acinetobacter bereziniae]TNL61266.1 hypothetical protein EYY58_06570 [Acinetobacter bereziniae]
MEKIILIFVLIMMTACSSSNDAQRALEAQGFSSVQTHGPAFFSCAQGDTFATKFTAKNVNGKTVKGTVCSGWLKGSTIRFD